MVLTELRRESVVVRSNSLHRINTKHCSGENFRSGRLNNKKKDLNRDFPTWKDVGQSIERLLTGRQPETKVFLPVSPFC